MRKKRGNNNQKLYEPKALEQNPSFLGKDLDLVLAPSCMIESIEAKKKYDIALEKLDYKIGRYEIAQKTGELTWD
jgi:hypothetical protein